MTAGPGAPYPHPNPAPGSNQIGQFQIGISPIGDISPFDVWTTMLSQYANSGIIATLVTNMAQYVDQTQNFDEFYDTIWNVDTAVGYGLDLWGRIVGVTRTLALPSSPPQPYLGFEEAGQPTTLTPFGQAPFFSGQPTTTNFSLTDDAYRPLILAKALANICDGSIPATNQILINLFGQGYVTDGLNLTMKYTFTAALTAQQLAIANSGVIPRPSGVAASVVNP